MMSTSVHTTLPAADLERAKRFYTEKLGLKPIVETPAGVFFEAGGTRFILYPTKNPNRGGHTQMGLTTENIEKAVAEMKARGIKFEEYDMPGLKTEGGIAKTGDAWAAWFKDSEDNIIGVVQLPPEVMAKL